MTVQEILLAWQEANVIDPVMTSELRWSEFANVADVRLLGILYLNCKLPLDCSCSANPLQHTTVSSCCVWPVFLCFQRHPSIQICCLTCITGGGQPSHEYKISTDTGVSCLPQCPSGIQHTYLQAQSTVGDFEGQHASQHEPGKRNQRL
jgi:hypothetical protein